MNRILIEGGIPLRGEIPVSGAKNAVLPLMAATLLADGICVIDDVPALADVNTMCQVLASLGTKCNLSDSTLSIDTSGVYSIEAPGELVRKMRASFLIMGPLLAKHGSARMSLPGGCAIGARPIDLHLKGFESMGAEISIGHGYIEARASKLIGNRVYLDFPSVGATENIMMAASLAEGNTVIENAAEEPEIVDLSNLLSAMGAKIKGAGTSIIRIEGVERLKAARHTVIPDRIEAGSFMVMAAATGGDVLITNVISEHLKAVIAKLEDCGAQVIEELDGLRVVGNPQIEPADIKTMPYPGFATDMQAQFTAYLSCCRGTSVVTEAIFENRFMHIEELNKMGADIRVEGNSAIINGVSHLKGTSVVATDLRAGAAMIIAGLMSKGQTEITEIQHILRGYENICEKLSACGAKIKFAQ